MDILNIVPAKSAHCMGGFPADPGREQQA